MLRLGARLGRGRYSLWLSAHTSLRSAMIARCTGAKVRIGYDRPRSNAWFYTHLVPRRFGELEELERLLQLLRPLERAGERTPLQVWPEIGLSTEAVRAAEMFYSALASTHPDSPVLGLHPGSNWGTKRWLPEHYATVAAWAAKEGAVALVFGGADEKAVAAEVATRAAEMLPGAAKGRVVDVSGMWALPELAAIIKGLACYVTNDSGPMHLAWPQHVPVTAIFGPTTRGLGFFPRGGTSNVIEVDLSCRPCGMHGPQVCPLGHHNCMRLVTPEMVWQDIAPKLFNSRAPLI